MSGKSKRLLVNTFNAIFVISHYNQSFDTFGRNCDHALMWDMTKPTIDATIVLSILWAV